MVDATNYIWMDGTLVPWNEARVHVLTHTLHYGFGVFEGIRAYATGPSSGSVFRLDDHARRLTDTARIAGLALTWSHEDIARASLETLRANRLTEAYVRPICFLGEGPMDVVSSLNPVHTAIAVWHWGPYLGAQAMQHGIRCNISTFTRIGLRDHLPKGKFVGHYVNSILAKDEAKRLGFDEALMMDEHGNVLEGTSENIFVARNGRLITPPLESAILGGITRDTAIELARDLGYVVDERHFGRDTLYLADEVFLNGTAAEVTPVREIDGRRIGNGSVGPITRRLQDAFAALVRGKNDKYEKWLARYELAP